MARGGNPQVLFDRAVAALQAGDLARAGRDARKLTKQAANVAGAWSLRATVALRAGEQADAAKFFRRAVLLDPNDPGLLNNLANVTVEMGAHADAIPHYRRSLELRPGHVDTLMNLGNAYIETRAPAEAMDCFERVLAADPGNAGARLNLGGAYMLARRFDDALETFQALRENGADDVGVCHSIYNALVVLDRLDEADDMAATLAEIAPDDPKVAVSLSVLHFLRERWADGWRGFAARWRWKPEEARPFPQPWWEGEPLTGRKVLAWGEQGLGDEVMYASMIPDLAATGAEVVLECDPRLVGIFGRAFPGVACVPRTDPPQAETLNADIDFQVPISNLGIWFRADEAAFGGGAPFLHADADRVRAIERQYRAGDDVALVGITWKSFNPDMGDKKSMTLDEMVPVLSQPGVRFVDLQYGDRAGDLDTFLADHDIDLLRDESIDPTQDVEGHLAQLAAMDLVISISNSSVHLASAAGVPVWCLIQKVPGRRWLLDRDDSPWYASVRLYRQDAPMDWRAPVARVAEDLGKWIADRRAKGVSPAS